MARGAPGASCAFSREGRAAETGPQPCATPPTSHAALCPSVPPRADRSSAAGPALLSHAGGRLSRLYAAPLSAPRVAGNGSAVVTRVCHMDKKHLTERPADEVAEPTCPRAHRCALQPTSPELSAAPGGQHLCPQAQDRGGHGGEGRPSTRFPPRCPCGAPAGHTWRVLGVPHRAMARSEFTECDGDTLIPPQPPRPAQAPAV